MGKKLISQASTKISKSDRKNLNSLIKILKPKVYITDASNFKRLVQDLTGNKETIMPGYNVTPPSIPKQVMQIPVVDIDDHDDGDDQYRAIPYQERSFGSSVNSSEASMLTSFNTNPAESPQEFCVSDATFSAVFEISLTSSKLDLPVYGDIESWLMEIDPYNYQDSSVPAYQKQVGDYNYDFSELS